MKLRGKRMRRLMVRLGERSYPIYFGHGCLGEAGAIARRKGFGRKALVVSDPEVCGHYGEEVRAGFERAGIEPSLFLVPAGERSKSLSWAARLYEHLIGLGFERNCGIIALGGGVVGDLSGFVAATFLRGVPLMQLPTSLLAQVDSSVGGKTAVNHPKGKNLIGAFYQPGAVLIDSATLSTLPRRELLSGLAEVVKCGVIADPRLFATLERRAREVLNLDPEVLLPAVAACCRIKARVVEQDARELGLRAILNFGHTIGHALETMARYKKLRHGEAVAIGMAAAARISSAMKLCKAEEAGRVLRLLSLLGLPTSSPSFSKGRLLEQLSRDKKVRDGRVRFVLMRGIGRVEIRDDVPQEL
ncbi:MAG: 3-dehydroquinate synthase, partial [Nitrospinota bacterium]